MTVPEVRADLDRAPRGGRVMYGPWTVDLIGGLLERDGRETRLTRRTAAVFRVLVAHAGETVTREALIQQVWPDSYPTDDVVTKAIRELRQALGDDPRGGQFVETIPRVGYRLTGPFTQSPSPAPAPAIVETAEPAAAGDETTIAEAPAAPAPGPAGSRFVWIGLALTVLALAAIAWFAPRAANERGGTAGRGGAASFAVPELQRALVERIRPLTALPGAELLGTLSPDGRVLAYSARESLSAPFRIFIAPVETLERRPLSTNAPSEATELVPEWSPDGRTIAFQRVKAGDCSVLIATSASRSQRRLTGCEGLFAQHHAFTPDGRYLAILRPVVEGGPTRLHLMALDTGATEPLKYDIPQDPWESDVEARFSTDGRFLAVRRGRAPYGGLYVVDLVQNTSKPVVEHSRVLGGFDWMPDSRTLLVAAGYGTPSALWLYHEPNGTLEYVGTTSLRRPRFARRARLAVFAQSTVDSVVSRFSLDGDADATPNVPVRTYESTYSEQYPAREPSGDRTAFVSSRAGSPQLFVADDAEGEVQQVTHFESGAVTWPRWRPDGSEIVFVHSNDEHDALHVVRVGDSWTRVLDAGLKRVQRADFSPDGEWIYYDGFDRGQWETWRMHRDGGARERVVEGAFGPLSTPTAIGGVVAVDPLAGAFVHVDAEGKRRTLAAGWLHDWNRWAWDTGDAGIYFVWGSRLDDFGLYLQPWDGSEPRLVVRVPRLLPSFGLSIDERARFALVGQSASDEADLVLLDLHMSTRGPR